MRTLIRAGRVIDPSQEMDRVTNLLVEDGRIAAYDVEPDCEQTIDATGRLVVPGLIDTHAQLREPGWEEDETIETGTAAALAGGYTSLLCLPETDPPLDTQAGVEYVRQKAARARNCRVYVAACVSKNREGKELAEIGSLVEAGAVALTDAEQPIGSTELLRRALEYCLMFDKPLMNRPESVELSREGIMHEGFTSLVLGLQGMPAEAEDVMTGRDIRLAEATGGRLHLMAVSTATTIASVRAAKHRQVRVTAGICPPQFLFDDECLRSFDSAYKLNPPLRSEEHREACLAGLADGTIDVIASGHAPRASEKKMRELDLAPFGMVSLETTLAAVITELVRPGRLSWHAALEKLTLNPARLLGLDAGTLQLGAPADVTIIDPDYAWTVDPAAFRSKSNNTPLAGRQLFGRATHVLVDGELRFTAE